MYLPERAFGEDSDSGFDMNSLFTVDESALQKAFGMDGSSLNGLSDALALPSSMSLQDTFTLDGGSMNLSGMVDLSQINLDVSDMPEFNLGDMLSHLDITDEARWHGENDPDSE